MSMIRKQRPPGVRLALAESKMDEPSFAKRKARAWFRCARVDTHEAGRKGGGSATEIAYPTHQPWQEDLAKALGKQIHPGSPIDLATFQPRQVPIALLGPDPMAWLDIHLACWSASCTGRHVLGPAYALKSDEMLQQPEQAKALHAQGIDPSDKERSEVWIGTATRTEGLGPKIIACDPLMCRNYNSPDKTKCCKITVDFSFTVGWARGQTTGSFFARAWGSAARLKTSIEDLQDQLAPYNCTLSGVPCWLTADPRAVSYDGGKTGTQPAVSVSLRGTLDELAEIARNRMALGGINADAIQKGLPERAPTMREIRETRAGRLGTSSEFEPDAYDAQVGAENAWRARYSPHLSETVLDDILHRCDTDLRAADDIAESMIRKADEPASDTEEPIDAEFEADDGLDELKRQYKEAAEDVPPDVQKGWFADVGCEWGQQPTIEQAKGLLKLTTGGGQ